MVVWRRGLYEPYNPAVKGFTVDELLRASHLDLRLVAGAAGLSNPIRWAHVSELDDPTPWLRGGEILLTTGMGLGTTPARQRAYLARLVDAGLAGLGVGTGFSFARVPRPLALAADAARFPLFEVPYEVPFIAITEAVFAKVAAEQYDLLSRSLDAEHVLTRAVLDGTGIDGIVGALTQATRGWAILLDLHGGEFLWCGPSSSRPGPRGPGSASPWSRGGTTSRSSRWRPRDGWRRSSPSASERR
jgi:purine catabolism regulator